MIIVRTTITFKIIILNMQMTKQTFWSAGVLKCRTGLKAGTLPLRIERLDIAS